MKKSAKVKLQKLSPQQLQKLYKQKRQEGDALQSVKHIHWVLHRTLNDAIPWNSGTQKCVWSGGYASCAKTGDEGSDRRAGTKFP